MLLLEFDFIINVLAHQTLVGTVNCDINMVG